VAQGVPVQAAVGLDLPRLGIQAHALAGLLLGGYADVPDCRLLRFLPSLGHFGTSLCYRPFGW
jgi:hypothetical protein